MAQSLTVYAIDDDDAVRDSMRTLLEREGFAARTYSSGAAFLREARPHANSCLVIDLEMPGMSGLDLLEKIRQAGVAVPAIITAERTDQRIQSAVAGAGATLLEKPYSPDELVLSIRKACDERAC